jgi:beta-1,4-mannosyltransferase
MTPPPGVRRVGIVRLDVDTGNPYLASMVDALAARGIEAVPARLRPRALVRQRRAGVSVIHVHWPEFLATPPPGRFGRLKHAYYFARMTAAVLALRPLGFRRVWTVHNLGPHESSAPWWARWPYALVARTTDTFVTHSADAGERAAARFPQIAGHLVVAPHGNYRGVYGAAPAGAAAALRAAHGIPEGATLLVAFGQVRAYKRVAELAALVAATDDLHLLVAGSPVDREHAAELERLAAGSSQVHLELRRIPDEEVGTLYAAADLAVLHYREAFSSGALLLALTEGAAVVMPQSKAAAEVAGFPALAMYEGDDLAGAVARVMAVPAEERRAAALAAADAASWDLTAERLEQAYFG